MPLRFRVHAPAVGPGAEVAPRTVDVEPVDGEVTIGRRAGVTVELPFATISGIHARCTRRPGGWSIMDLGSANGTYVGQRRLAARTECPLGSNETLRLGDVTLVFEGELRPGDLAAADAKDGAKNTAEGAAESTATIARRLVSDLFRASRPAEVARLVVASGRDGDIGRSLVLDVTNRSYRVGRSSQCELALADDDVSREHAAFERRWEGVSVRDLGSKNGVEIGGEKIVGPCGLRDGDIVTLGGTRLRLEDPQDGYLRRMREEEAKAPDPSAPAETPSPAIEEASEAPVSPAEKTKVTPGPSPAAVVAVTVLLGVVALVLWLVVG